MRKKYTGYKRILCIMLVCVLATATLAGCSGKTKGKTKSLKAVTNFLNAAKEMDYEKAGKYATDETMENLGWNDMDSDSLEDVFYSSMGLTDSEIETLKQDSEVTDAVDRLVEKMAYDVKDYKIQKGTYEADGDKAKVKVTVTRITAEQLGQIFEDVQDDIDEQAKSIGEELKSGSDTSSSKTGNSKKTDTTESDDTDISDEEMNVEVIRRLIPSIVPSMIEKLDEAEGEDEEWVVEMDTKKNKVTGVYESGEKTEDTK